MDAASFPGLRMPASGASEAACSRGPLPGPLVGPRWGNTLPKPTDGMEIPEILWTDDADDNKSTGMSAASSLPESLDKHSVTSSQKGHLSKGMSLLIIYVYSYWQLLGH